MSEILQREKSYFLRNLKPEGRFISPVRNTHHKESFSYEDGGKTEKRIIKYLPYHSARSEVVGSAIFQVLGLRAPKTFIAEGASKPAIVMEDLSEEFVADLTYGEGGVMTDEALKNQFKQCLLAAILIGDYDRVPWNAMISRDFSRVGFVDFGACCGSRAQGGFNGFNSWIDVEEIRHAVADPFDLEVVSNKAFLEVIDIKNGRLIMKDPELLRNLAQQLRNLRDDTIDTIVRLAEYPNMSNQQEREQAVKYIDGVLADLARDLKAYNNLRGRDYIKTKRAAETYMRIATDFRYDMGAYFAFALKQRRDDLVRMFIK